MAKRIVSLDSRWTPPRSAADRAAAAALRARLDGDALGAQPCRCCRKPRTWRQVNADWLCTAVCAPRNRDQAFRPRCCCPCRDIPCTERHAARWRRSTAVARGRRR